MTRYELEDRLLHGGDYNPDQWLDHPEILEKDLELMEIVGAYLMKNVRDYKVIQDNIKI